MKSARRVLTSDRTADDAFLDLHASRAQVRVGLLDESQLKTVARLKRWQAASIEADIAGLAAAVSRGLID